MAGPYPQYPDPIQPGYSEPYPSQPLQTQPPPPLTSLYPGAMPPPVSYPRQRRWWLLAAVAAVIAVVAAVGVVIAYATRGGSTDAAGGDLSPASAKAAIQNYLDAMSKGDYDTVARNTLCGMYDAVRDRKSDEALARLASDAFRKQFARADVTTIDKMVFWSPNQAQVLFTLHAVPAGRTGSGDQEQAIAQLLSQDNQVLVCSYLLRTAAQY